MAKAKEALYAFNRGIASALALVRVDVKRLAMSAETMTNWVPQVLGAMVLRAGLGYKGASYAATTHIPFVFSNDDTALIELSPSQLRVWVDDALVTRPSVSTTITNPTLTGATGWTDLDEAGAASTLVSSGGYDGYQLIGTGSNAAIRSQTVTVAAADQNSLHALRILITYGSATFRIGTVLGADDVLEEVTLYAGTHSITFVPLAATVYLQMLNREVAPCWVDYCGLDPAGVLALPTAWATEDNLDHIRHDQSGDIVYVACDGVQQYAIERRDNDSWSVVNYTPEDGPYNIQNLTTITLTPSDYTGAITLTASRSLFSTTQIGGMFRVTHRGQRDSATLSALNATTASTYDTAIRVTGVGAERALLRQVTTTALVGTLTLQRDVGGSGIWADVTTVTDGTVSYNDGLDNQTVYYRLTLTAYTSGSVAVVLSYPLGTTTGLCRITGYTSPTVVSALVVAEFSALTASEDWAEGSWSAKNGYPSAVGLHDGRLWWAGKDKIDASVSDDYYSFDDETVGDSGPLSRTIGVGPTDEIRWLLAPNRMIMGGQMAERVLRSTDFGEPITPSNFNLRNYGSRGSGSVSGIVVDGRILFVDRSGKRVHELIDQAQSEVVVKDITTLAPEVCAPLVKRIAVQRLPETRVHFVLSDGTVALLVYDRLEEISSWSKIVTDGLIKDAAVLPATSGEDQVYYVVQRTVNGSTVNYLEKFAEASTCIGAAVNNIADSYTSYTGVAVRTISGLNHLIGETVVCWANGVDLGTFTVSATGQVVLPAAYTNVTIGLPYTAQFKSSRLGMMGQSGPTLTAQGKRRATRVSLILANTHAQGLRYGTDFDYLDDMPGEEEGAAVAADTMHSFYDGDPIELNGTFENKTQLCLEAAAPRPCTVVAAVVEVSED